MSPRRPALLGVVDLSAVGLGLCGVDLLLGLQCIQRELHVVHGLEFIVLAALAQVVQRAAVTQLAFFVDHVAVGRGLGLVLLAHGAVGVDQVIVSGKAGLFHAFLQRVGVEVALLALAAAADGQPHTAVFAQLLLLLDQLVTLLVMGLAPGAVQVDPLQHHHLAFEVSQLHFLAAGVLEREAGRKLVQRGLLGLSFSGLFLRLFFTLFFGLLGLLSVGRLLRVLGQYGQAAP